MNKLFLLLLLLTPNILFSAIQISNLEDLQKIGRDAAFPFDESYELTGDIDASGSAEMNAGEGFKTIAGGWGEEFSGTLDGKGYTIRGLVINSPSIYLEPIGIFGYIGETGTVKNLKVLDASVHGYQRVGIIAGYNKGTIEDCMVSGTVSSEKIITGGIAGVNGGVNMKQTGTINRCIAIVDVKGSRLNSGGIAGWCYKGTISECGVFGSVSGVEQVGGILGACNGAKVSRTFSMASVTGDSTVAGMISWVNTENENIVSEITECWSSGRVSAKKSSGGAFAWASTEAILQKNYWDTDRSGKSYTAGNDGVFGLTTEEMLKSSSYAGWQFPDTWKNREGVSFPSLAWMNFEQYTVTYEAGAGGSVEGELTQKLDMLSVGTPVTVKSSEGSHFIRWSDGSYDETRVDVGVYSDTTISALFAAPMPISSLSDLEKIGNDPEYPLDYYYYLTGDIDGGSASISTIGGTEPFYGSFDGKGFTISNLTVAGPLFYTVETKADIKNLKLSGITASSDADPVGVLAGRNYGTLHNINIKESSVTTSANIVGGLVGVNHSGTISNCVVSAEVTTTEVAAGGLIGYNRGTVKNSGAEGAVTARVHAGGLIGYQVDGTVSQCYAKGAATSQEWAAGGAVAYMLGGRFENCYAAGEVNGGDTTKDMGGFVGNFQKGEMSNCYNSGKINGKVDGFFGGFAGFALDVVPFENCFWDKTQSGVETSVVGTGLSPKQMYLTGSFTGWDFTDIWKIADKIGVPVLRWEGEPIPTAITTTGKAIAKQSAKLTGWSNKHLSVELPAGITGSVSLYQVNGREVFSGEVTGVKTVKLPNLGAGIFITRITAPGIKVIRTIHIK